MADHNIEKKVLNGMIPKFLDEFKDAGYVFFTQSDI
jgi:hypothetical protein